MIRDLMNFDNLNYNAGGTGLKITYQSFEITWGTSTWTGFSMFLTCLELLSGSPKLGKSVATLPEPSMSRFPICMTYAVKLE